MGEKVVTSIKSRRVVSSMTGMDPIVVDTVDQDEKLLKIKAMTLFRL